MKTVHQGGTDAPLFGYLMMSEREDWPSDQRQPLDVLLRSGDLPSKGPSLRPDFSRALSLARTPHRRRSIVFPKTPGLNLKASHNPGYVVDRDVALQPLD